MVPNNRIHGFWFNSSQLNPPPDFASFPMTQRSAYRPPPSPEEIRFQALLQERLTALRHSRRGLWSRFWCFVWGD